MCVSHGCFQTVSIVDGVFLEEKPKVGVGEEEKEEIGEKDNFLVTSVS